MFWKHKKEEKKVLKQGSFWVRRLSKFFVEGKIAETFSFKWWVQYNRNRQYYG